ncbi:MAG: hypothetical protein R6T91_01025 [Bacteroidales bacterium]
MNMKFVLPFIACMVFSFYVFSQQSQKEEILIQTNMGELQAFQSHEDMPLNVAQFKSSVLYMSNIQQPDMILFDQNDISTILYGVAYAYFLSDMVYSLYAYGNRDVEEDRLHIFEPFDNEVNNFLFTGAVTMGLTLMASLLCTDTGSCRPSRRFNLF